MDIEIRNENGYLIGVQRNVNRNASDIADTLANVRSALVHEGGKLELLAGVTGFGIVHITRDGYSWQEPETGRFAEGNSHDLANAMLDSFLPE